MISFRLWTIFYVFALFAAAMATFGPVLGIIGAVVVLVFWARCRSRGWLINVVQLTGLVAIMIGFALVIPSQSARRAAQREECVNKLKMNAIALQNFHDTRKTFPLACVTDANGKPMHSWRVLLTPHFCDNFIDKYVRSEPWDGPTNRTLANAYSHSYYCCPNDENGGNTTEANFFAVVDPETAFPPGRGRPMKEFKDGLSKTILLIEASGRGVHWMEPRDLTLDEAVELLTSKPETGHTYVRDGFLTSTCYKTAVRHVAYCDGSVQEIGQIADAQIARALLTAAGGETISSQLRERYIEPETVEVVKWGRVWGLTLFVVLSLLPALLPRRQYSTSPGHENPDYADAAEFSTVCPLNQPV
jgi:hypothetical protein